MTSCFRLFGRLNTQFLISDTHQKLLPSFSPSPSYASATLEMHAGCMHAGCMQPASDRMQEVAGCSILHAACMQAACRLHYASSVAASIEIYVHIPGIDAVCRASTPCTPGSMPCTLALTPCMQAASRLHAGRQRQENTPRMNMLILGVFFRAYFSIFSL